MIYDHSERIFMLDRSSRALACSLPWPFREPAERAIGHIQQGTFQRSMSLLVAGTTLPLILFAAGLVYVKHVSDREAASDGFRTYMLMLLTGAPVLINDPTARHFLEQAQYLGGLMARMLAEIDKSPKGTAVPDAGLQDAVRQLQSAVAPLLQLLTPAIRDAINGIGQTAEE